MSGVNVIVEQIDESVIVEVNPINNEVTVIISSVTNTVANGLNQQQIIYVSKAGNDSNSGLQEIFPKLTIDAAITTGVALLPSVTNQIVIKGIGAGNFTEDVDLPEWMHLDFSDGSLDGTLDVSDNTITTFRRLQKTSTGGSVVKKTTGTGFAKITVDLLIVSDATQNGFLLNSGVGGIDIGAISVDGGIGIKAKNGSRVSFTILEVQLLNGGTGIGTQVAGGDPNLFSGNILYAMDDGSGTLLKSKVVGDIINIQGGSFLIDELYDIGASTTLNVFVNEATGTRTADPTAVINVINLDGDSSLAGFVFAEGFKSVENDKNKLFRSDGTVLGVTITPDTEQTIDLTNILGNLCNMASANVSTGYDFNGIDPVAGGNARVLIKAPSEPNITGANIIDGSDFIADTDMYMVVWNNGNRSEFWFETIEIV